MKTYQAQGWFHISPQKLLSRQQTKLGRRQNNNCRY